MDTYYPARSRKQAHDILVEAGYVKGDEDIYDLRDSKGNTTYEALIDHVDFAPIEKLPRKRGVRRKKL